MVCILPLFGLAIVLATFKKLGYFFQIIWLTLLACLLDCILSSMPTTIVELFIEFGHDWFLIF
jgi:hypothetical protein